MICNFLAHEGEDMCLLVVHFKLYVTNFFNCTTAWNTEITDKRKSAILLIMEDEGMFQNTTKTYRNQPNILNCFRKVIL